MTPVLAIHEVLCTQFSIMRRLTASLTDCIYNTLLHLQMVSIIHLHTYTAYVRYEIIASFYVRTWRPVPGQVGTPGGQPSFCRTRPHSHCQLSRAEPNRTDSAWKRNLRYEMAAFALHAEPNRAEPDRACCLADVCFYSPADDRFCCAIGLTSWG